MNNKRIVVRIFDGDNVILKIDKNLLFAEFGALDRGSLTNVAEWGIYVNRGSFSFIDDTGFFDNQTTNTIGFLGYIAKFYLVDKIAQTLIGTFVVKSAKIKEETREVTIECVSKLENLQRKNAKTLYPDIYEVYNTRTLLNLIRENYIENNPEDPFNITTEGDIERLEKSIVYSPYFGEESLWSRINKVCEASMCRVFDNEQGNPVITGSFPEKTPIIIKPNNIINLVRNDYVSIKNSYISVTDRRKFLNQNFFLPNVKENFKMNFNDEKEFVSVSNSDTFSVKLYGDFNESFIIVKFSKNIKTSCKIYGNALVIATIEYEDYKKNEDGTIMLHNTPYSIEHSIGDVGVNLYSEIQLDEEWKTGGFVVAVDSIFIQERIASIFTEFKADHFIDYDPIIKKHIISEDSDAFEIPSNDLIQTESYYLNEDESQTNLGDHILQEINRRYGKGIECFEIECLFNDYYDITGEKVFDKDDLSNHFKRYDVVIPYVKRGGATVPLRTDKNGEPKQFRIIGIYYSYDGLLRQKLQLQEERYDVD